MRLPFALIPAMALVACAGRTAPSARSYSAELAGLESACSARGGILLPLRTPSAWAGADYYCNMRGPGERFRSPLGRDTRAR